MRRLLVALTVLALLFAGAMYATDSWIFAFAPTSVDQLSFIYTGTGQTVALSSAQATAVLRELRAAPAYPTISDPTDQPISHQLIAVEGDRQLVYYVILQHDLVTDSSYQNLRQLGPRTKQLLAELKPTLPGQLDVAVPEHVGRTLGSPLPFTRYLLPVAYASPDFRVVDSGAWPVDWSKQVMILAAWGEQPTGGYHLSISGVSVVDDYLCVTVAYACPPPAAAVGPPSCPADAVLIDRDAISGLIGACWLDEDGAIFSSQALGSYPVERQLRPWPTTISLPLVIPPEGSGLLTALVEDSRIGTVVVYYNHQATSHPVITRIVEVSRGEFLVDVVYEPGEVRQDAVIISGWGSNWAFRLR